MPLIKVEVRIHVLNSKKPVVTLHFDETNVWTGWPEVLKTVGALLTRRS